MAPHCGLAPVFHGPNTLPTRETHNLVGRIICELAGQALFENVNEGKERR
jgi:hypothetical protein